MAAAAPPSIVLIGAWFGPWPAWIDFFFISCGANRDIDWLIFSDQPPPTSMPANVKVITIELCDYKAEVGARLGVVVHPDAGGYKMCDLKPALGHLHYDRIRGYDFFGYCDIDVIFGDIRHVYDEDLLDRYDALGTHTSHISGHLFLMRNTRKMRQAFMSIPGWKEKLQERRYTNLDEQDFYKVFRPGAPWGARILGPGRRRPSYFKEAYSTPMPTVDMRWYWKAGMLSNEFYPRSSFLYLHFMVWQSNKWYPLIDNVTPGAPAPWTTLAELVQLDWRTGQDEGFMISPAGIQPIEVRPYP